MDDETQYRVTMTGEPTRLVRAYRHAVGRDRRLRAWLIASGLDPDDLTVTAGVSESGQPVVHVTVLPVLAVHLSALIAQDGTQHPLGRDRQARVMIRTQRRQARMVGPRCLRG